VGVAVAQGANRAARVVAVRLAAVVVSVVVVMPVRRVAVPARV
jgi:hypothetical protein